MPDVRPLNCRTTIAASMLMSLTLIGGCAHRAIRIETARQSFLLGDVLEAERQYEQLLNMKRNKTQEILLADQAIIDLSQGKTQSAEDKLRLVRDGFDHLEQKDLRESALSIVSDDRQQAYAGEDYEKVLVRNLLAVANLMHGGEDAIAYCLQSNQKQSQIIEKGFEDSKDNPKLAYKRVALGPYLYGAIQESSHRNYDDAKRAYAMVGAWNPGFQTIENDLNRVTYASHSVRGNGAVYVITFVGPGPFKQETVAPVTSDALLIASQILHAVGDKNVPQFSAAVKIPEIVVPPSDIVDIRVFANDQFLGSTQTITDVGQLAIQQADATRNQTIARAVVRRLVKKGAVYEAKGELSSDSIWAGLAFDAAGFLWEAAESADTRCWGLLPGRIQVLRCELPAGTHMLSFRAERNKRPIGPAYESEIVVVDGRNSYAFANFPNETLVGKIVTSQ